jgi:hypothetical protein
MPFEQDTAVATATGGLWGNYLRSFRSENGQVLVYLFEQDGWLIAHVTRPTGVKIDEITDRFVNELHQFAREQGFEGKFRIIYVE